MTTTDRRWRIAAIALLVALALIVIGAFGPDPAEEDANDGAGQVYEGGPTEGAFASDDPQGRPGKAEVYNRIAVTVDCGELQATFDRTMADVERREPDTYLRTVSLSYATAADEQMRALGCPGHAP